MSQERNRNARGFEQQGQSLRQLHAVQPGLLPPSCWVESSTCGICRPTRWNTPTSTSWYRTRSTRRRRPVTPVPANCPRDFRVKYWSVPANSWSATANLRDVRIGSTEVTGYVRREVTAPNDSGQHSIHPEARFRCFSNGSDLANNELRDLLQQHNINYSHAPPPGIWAAYMPLMVICGIFILLFVYMMRRMGGAGSPMAFGRSRGRLYAQEDLGICFSDVAGIDEAVEEVKEIVDFLKSPEKYQRLGGRIPEGRSVGRPTRYGQNPAGEGHRRRSGRTVLQPVRIRFRRDVRRAWVPPASVTCSNRPSPRRPASSSSTNWTPWAKPAAPASWADTTNASRR